MKPNDQTTKRPGAKRQKRTLKTKEGGPMNTTNIFGRKQTKIAPKPIKPTQPPKQRKKRSDTKKDIKFRLSAHDKTLLQLRAKDAGLSLTEFCSQVVKTDLLLEREYKNYEYDNNGKFVHCLLELHYHEMAVTLHIEWDLPLRKVAHRIIKEYLNREFGRVEISSYNDK